MSEFQFVLFQAVDRPLDDAQLEFAERQSTRADVTRWRLSVEYHYSSFRGEVDELLRCGYDVFLQYTSYGTREIKLRLPGGLPFAPDLRAKYLVDDRLDWQPDADGPAGILTLSPWLEGGGYDDAVVAHIERLVDSVVRVREQLMQGDLRALYMLWLCAASSDDVPPETTIEPPVPHGIADTAANFATLLNFFDIDPLLPVAAASDTPLSPPQATRDRAVTDWLESLDERQLRRTLFNLLMGDTADEKLKLLVALQANCRDAWPTSDPRRSYERLLELTAVLRDAEEERLERMAEAEAREKAAAADRARAKRIKEISLAPEHWLRETERLVELKGTANYQAAAEILHDLREAVGGDQGARMARQQAAKLAKKNPSLNMLKASLRKRGLLDS